MKPTLGTTSAGPLVIDVARLVQTRMLLTANSGAGKSWALRRLLEQTHGRAQQLVIDPEGEFYTLREKLPYVLAGKGGDCPAEPRSAPLLARRLLELGASAVLDLYELAPRDRVRFVRAFLESLIDAPRSLWHPVLVVIDEAHAYAPEKGHGEAESMEAVSRLMAQGRKRGFAGVLATQRVSKLAKDVAAEANNLLIGRAALDVDLKRAGEALGLPRGEWNTLRALAPGSFYAFGPALADTVQLVHVGHVETAHPQAGARAAAAPPPPEKVRAVLAKLADLPAEAEQEARSADELRAKLRAVERELAQAKRAAPLIDKDILDRAVAEGRQYEQRQSHRAIAQAVASANAGRERASRALDQALAQIKLAADALREPIDVPEMPITSRGLTAATAAPIRQIAGPRQQAAAVKADLRSRSGESRMLAILAQHYPHGLPVGQWAALAAMKRSGGTWSTYLSRLRTREHVEERGGLWLATEAGVEAAGVVPEQPSTPEEVLAMWETKPGMAPVVRIVRVLLENGGELPTADLAALAGMTASGGTYSTYLSRGRTAGLITTSGGAVKAEESLR